MDLNENVMMKIIKDFDDKASCWLISWNSVRLLKKQKQKYIATVFQNLIAYEAKSFSFHNFEPRILQLLEACLKLTQQIVKSTHFFYNCRKRHCHAVHDAFFWF